MKKIKKEKVLNPLPKSVAAKLDLITRLTQPQPITFDSVGNPIEYAEPILKLTNKEILDLINSI